MQVPEINPQWPSTWDTLTEDDVISQGEARWFRKALVKLAGKNPLGKPILQLVWGQTYVDPMLTEAGIKYIDFQPEGREPIGERRWFVEIWRSPEFLERSGRYQMTTRQDVVTGEKLLQPLTSAGCYDYWLRLERLTTIGGVPTLSYQMPDREALGLCQRLWDFELKTLGERNAIEDAERERARRLALAEQRSEQNRLWGSERDYVLSPYITRPMNPLIIIPS